MTVEKSTGAISDINWHDIDWSSCDNNIKKLQARIVKAVQEKHWNKVKSLQRLLTCSFSGKALAVKKVTENHGKKTPGVDGELWSDPVKKSEAITQLKQHGYKVEPLKRISIPKSNGKLRHLGIPTIKDRAMQALFLMALDPISETISDPNSYGFRKFRSPKDAMSQCFIDLSTNRAPQWILEGDIEGCFDNINHQWLLDNIPMNKDILNKWLKSGFISNNKLFPTDSGTPQGGIISPVLANMTLNGIEQFLIKHYRLSKNGKMDYRIYGKNKVNFVRYADDFIITGTSPELLEEIKSKLQIGLSKVGLKLNLNKTKITHIDDGFDFLGWNFRKYNGKLLIKPSKDNIKEFLTKLRNIVKSNKTVNQKVLIGLINPIITGWGNYHCNVVAKEIFQSLDHEIFKIIWNWATRMHHNKSAHWIKDRYFKRIETNNWIFNYTNENGRIVTLKQLSDIPIIRHIKTKSDSNPYDAEQEKYFEKLLTLRMKFALTGHPKLLRILSKQNGKCPNCNQFIDLETLWDLHHIVPKSKGGSNDLKNLIMLHPNCHRQIHNNHELEVLHPA